MNDYCLNKLQHLTAPVHSIEESIVSKGLTGILLDRNGTTKRKDENDGTIQS
ncbi:MAG: hypothetical protein HQK63_16855 [Desulfamplus sp.]|nr:hypothetical protein [Desulfamplus sp.]